jgi:predicted dehydrogenase
MGRSIVNSPSTNSPPRTAEIVSMHAPKTNRRDFVRQSTAAMVAASAPLGLLANAHAGGSDTLRVGLVGCGGRGTGAAEQALTADKNTKLVAMADAFQDMLESSLSTLKGNSPVADRVDVPKDRQYAGFDAYKNVIDQVDVVLLATPPGFRPLHLAYAVEKGIHSFVEKPIATDAPGVRAVLKAAEEAKKKNLSMVSGLCWRYDTPRRETMKRALDGGIGQVVAIETTYDSGGVWDPRKRRDEVGSEMEYQMRNWYYYDWLSGDHIVEQAVHGIDTMAWAMGDEPPLHCFGSGGRQVRTEPEYGNIYDHFSIVYEYPNGVRGYHNCRHWRDTYQRTKDFLLGSKGTCDVFANSISGETKWRYRGPKPNMYQNEHDELFAAIRSGNPINNGVFMARSTLLGIMGRMAAYTGELITWDMALNSKEDLSPAAYAWGDAPKRPVPKPGTTKFV